VNRVLFVSNGHGEIAIAARIAAELHALRPMVCDHVALVGDFAYPSTMREVGPRRVMPSGGVVAMGNVRNIWHDLRAGLAAHTWNQWRFLRSMAHAYDAAIAVGDVFALVMALQARAAATIFVGTAKSVHVAPYGYFEERAISRAQQVFVRDRATAQRLQSHGIAAQAANVIVDLYAGDTETIDVPFDPFIAIFPGSRDDAYDDAVFLIRVVREIADAMPRAGGIVSIAPGLDPRRMRDRCVSQGWDVRDGGDASAPFSIYAGDREIVRAWRGSLAPMLARASIVLGQAGTANEAAAARGIPVAAFAPARGRTPWYRRRQIALLGQALMSAPADVSSAAKATLELLGDEQRMQRMGAIGRERMGEPGAARAIARQTLALVDER
jgi:uncharacterized protein (TIGR03492 family)